MKHYKIVDTGSFVFIYDRKIFLYWERIGCTSFQTIMGAITFLFKKMEKNNFRLTIVPDKKIKSRADWDGEFKNALRELTLKKKRELENKRELQNNIALKNTKS